MLDLKLIRNNNEITTDIYRKPTHTDQYLQSSSHHPAQQKIGIVKTLMHRANTLISDKKLQSVEKEKIRKALMLSGYSEWSLNEGEQLGKKVKSKKKDQEQREKDNGFAVLPYVKGVSERLQRCFKKHNISLYHKAGQTLRQSLVHPKDKMKPEEQCGIVYETECQVCGDIYIGETGRSLGERVEEHEKSVVKKDQKSALSQHQEKTGHVPFIPPLMQKIKIIEKESRERHRKVLEAINIRTKGAKLNRNDGVEIPDAYLPLLREEGAARGTQH